MGMQILHGGLLDIDSLSFSNQSRNCSCVERVLMPPSEDRISSEEIIMEDVTTEIRIPVPISGNNNNNNGYNTFFPDNNIRGALSSTSSKSCCGLPGKGIIQDIRRRFPHYLSDYLDGLRDCRALQKTLSTTVFLYFACLLPTMAFANLNGKTTHGIMDVRKGIFAQAVGQLVYSIFGGQHLNILLTTAPLSLFVHIVFDVSEIISPDKTTPQFREFYLCVGIWCCVFLGLSAIFNLSDVMIKFCTRSTEEIFAMFISIAFVVYAIKDTVHEFQEHYIPCSNHRGNKGWNDTFLENYDDTTTSNNSCNRAASLMFLILTCGTYLLANMMHNFRNSRFLTATIRQVFSDYALAISVVLFSFVGSFMFKDVWQEKHGPVTVAGTSSLFQLPSFQDTPLVPFIGYSIPLGLSLAVLIFMDQNIGAAIVNNPSNSLKKGPAYHYDMLVTAGVNVFCSLFTLPWLHVALPHAPLHVKNLAEMEQGVVLKVYETRVASILSHVLIGLSLFLLPIPLVYIRPSVFDGLYLFMGITALEGNHLWERILLFTSGGKSNGKQGQGVARRTSHIFTLLQIVQLLILCVLGFLPYPYMKILFPIFLMLMMVIRHTITKRLIDEKSLEKLD